MISIPREADASGEPIVNLCRRHGISDAAFPAWRRKFGQMSQAAVGRLRDLERGDVRLKQLVADRDLDVDVLKEYVQKK